MLLLAILGFSALVLFGGIHTYALVKMRASAVENIDAFANFFTAETQNGSTAFLDTVNAIAKITGHEVAQGTMNAINGSIGGATKGINAELNREGMESLPGYDLMKAFPKSVQKNPWMSILISRMIESMPKPGQASGVPSNGLSTIQTHFNL